MFSDKSRPRTFHPLTLLEGVCYFLLPWQIPDSKFKGENILFQFAIVGKAWWCPQWQKHGAEVLSIISDWKQMMQGRRMACSYQVPSLVVNNIPSQALDPNSSTMPKSIPPGRDGIQIQEPMGHFPFYIAGHLKGGLFLVFF